MITLETLHVDSTPPSENARATTLQAELDKMTQAYEKAVLSYTMQVKENETLKKSLKAFETSQEDDEILAQKWVKMADELYALKLQHQQLLNQSELTRKELLLTQSLFQKNKQALQITKELLKIESSTLQTQRRNNEIFSAKITALSETNEKLVKESFRFETLSAKNTGLVNEIDTLTKENTRLTQRVKFLESQIKPSAYPSYWLTKPANTTAKPESTAKSASSHTASSRLGKGKSK